MVAVIVNGNAPLVCAIPPALLLPTKDILPLTIPVPLLISLLSKSNPVIAAPCFVLISISLAAIAPLKFCCWKLNIILAGSALVSLALSNAITCESKLPISNFADVPSVPSAPCFDLASDIVLLNETLAEVAVIVIEPLSWVKPVTVTVLDEMVEVTPVPFTLANV